MTLKTSNVIRFSFLILLLGCTLGEAHSFISIPKGDYKTLNKAECRIGGPPHAPNDNCPGPCFKKSSFFYNTNAKNETTFHRGQQTEIVWTRNNHKGGFVRLSLVPADQRMNRTAHDENAFWFGCFTMGERRCNSRATCGTDGKKRALSARVKIPKCLPDGAYVLGWAWFGGVRFNGESYFGDYYSCSYVTIKGGGFDDVCHRIFEPEKGRTTCLSSTNKLGVCVREPCFVPRGREMIPALFEGGTPPPIHRPFGLKPRHTTSMGSQHQPEMIPSSTPSPAIMETPSNTPSASPSTSMSRTATPSPIPSKTPTGRAWVAGLKLMDVEKNKEVSRMFPGSVVVPHNVKKITFAAITRGDVRVVRFRLNGELTRTEFKEPFSMFGDIDGELYGWRKPIFNKWMTIQVMAKSATQKRHFKKFRVSFSMSGFFSLASR